MKTIDRLTDWALARVAPRGKARAATIMECWNDYKCSGGQMLRRTCCHLEGCSSWEYTTVTC